MEGARAARLPPRQLVPRPVDQPAGVAQVILLGDEEYEEDPVCEVLVKEIPEINNMNQVPPRRSHERSLASPSRAMCRHQLAARHLAGAGEVQRGADDGEGVADRGAQGARRGIRRDPHTLGPDDLRRDRGGRVMGEHRDWPMWHVTYRRSHATLLVLCARADDARRDPRARGRPATGERRRVITCRARGRAAN